MIARYILSQYADNDIVEIFDFGEKKFSLEQAIKYITELDLLFTALVKNPNIGKNRDEIKIGLFSFPYNSHIVFYRILQDHIRIVRVLHGIRDALKFL